MILEAGRNAPSAGNLQNWRFIVVMDKDKREKIAETCLRQYWMSSAPVHIVIVAQTEKAKMFYGERGEKLYSTQNCAAAAMNMMLQAHACGLATCWVGAFDEDMMKNTLGCGGDAHPQIVLTLGYPDEQAPTPKKNPLAEVTDLEDYGNKIKDVDVVLHRWGNVMQKKSKVAKEKLDETAEQVEKNYSGVINKIKNKFGKKD